MTIERFRISIPEDDLIDLKARLEAARWAHECDNGDGRYGISQDVLKPLVQYWKDEFDWRAQEAAMNQFAHYRIHLSGTPIHVMHIPGKGPDPMPLILSHGWPWTFWDWHKLIGPLSDPAAYGGDPADAFELIVPSMPGYGFSSPLATTALDGVATADLWAELMSRFGHQRFGAVGGDWGAFVTAQLGHKFPDRVAGILLLNGAPLDAATQPLPGAEDYAADEAGWHARTEAFFRDGFGYAAVQATRPQTLAWALEDSPLGLCAWLTDKRQAWSDCDGDVLRVFSRDELLTSISLYWLTGTAGSSFRYYFERRARAWSPAHDRTPVVPVPTAVLRFDGDICFWPRARLEAHFNLQRYTRRSRGGHFAPMEQPEAIVAEARDFFRTLRSSIAT